MAARATPSQLLALEAAADLLHPEDGRVLRALLRRLARGDPPLATDTERVLCWRLPGLLAVVVGEDDPRTAALAWLYEAVGAWRITR